VRAVAEPAARGGRGDVVERGREPLLRLPESQLPHPRGVEVEAAARKQQELAVGGRVPSAAVGAKIAGRHQLLAREAVDERRLADA